MAEIKLKVDKRKLTGRKVKALRKEGILPANIFGKKVDSMSVELPLADFDKIFEEAGETSVVTVSVEGEKESRPVLISNIQRDPVTGRAIHADFYQIDLKEKVTANVPVEFVGESPAEKQGLGTVVQYINELEVEALPGDLPESFEVDVTTLDEVDKSITVGDLKVDKSKVEVKAEAEEIVAKVEEQEEEEEEAVTPETEIIGEEGESAEGEDSSTDSDETKTSDEGALDESKDSEE